MMKKLFVCVSIVLMLGLTACGKSESNKDNATDVLKQEVTLQESEEKNDVDDENNRVEKDSDSEYGNETEYSDEAEEDSKIEETTTEEPEKDSQDIETTEVSSEAVIGSGSDMRETEVTITEDLEPSEEEQSTSDEELSKKFLDKYYGDKTDAQIQSLMFERSGFFEESSFYDTVMQFWQEERGATDTSYKFCALFYTDMRYYSEEDFKDVPIDIVVLAWNEIYARYGYRFKDENLENYFMGCLWYTPLESNEDFDENMLNKYEKHNIEILDKLLKAE